MRAKLEQRRVDLIEGERIRDEKIHEIIGELLHIAGLYSFAYSIYITSNGKIIIHICDNPFGRDKVLMNYSLDEIFEIIENKIRKRIEK
jgi:hypothetical protein